MDLGIPACRVNYSKDEDPVMLSSYLHTNRDTSPGTDVSGT